MTSLLVPPGREAEMSERVSSERLLALRQVVAVSAHLSLGEQEQVLLDLLDARTAFNEFQDEWSERFGFLAIKNQRDSLESIDEVACILNAANHSIRGEMEEGWRIANKEGARADIAEQHIKELERELDEAMPVLEAAQKQYDAAGSGWIGAWWLNPAFQGAAIELHKAIDAARAAAKEEEKQ